MFKLRIFLLIFACIGIKNNLLYSNDVASHIQHFLINKNLNKPLKVDQSTLFSDSILPAYYAQYNYKPRWVSHKDLSHANDLIRVISNCQYDGLNPLDYHCNQIVLLLIHLQKKPSDSEQLAIADILLTDAVLLLSSHLAQGKLNPNNMLSSWEIQRDMEALDFIQLLNNLHKSHAKDSIIQAFCQFTPEYLSLQNEVKKLYNIQFKYEDDWEIIHSDSTLKPGERHLQIPAIRKRMNWLKELNTATDSQTDSFVYDSILATAVMRFQFRNGLTMDGEIGIKTLKRMNQKPSYLIKKASVNLERYRWLPKPFPHEHLLVNITQFTLFYLKGTDTLLQSRAIVGKNYRKTPVFSAQLSYLVLSPTWTVPPGIFTNDVLPAVRKDPDYLRKKNMTVIDRQGQQVPDSLINWNAPRFPYMVRQAPGNQNSLGGVKFMFPNLHNV